MSTTHVETAARKRVSHDGARSGRFSWADLQALHRWAAGADCAGFHLDYDLDPLTQARRYVATWAEGDQFVSITRCRARPTKGKAAPVTTIQHQGTHVEMFDDVDRLVGRFATLADALQRLWPVAVA